MMKKRNKERSAFRVSVSSQSVGRRAAFRLSSSISAVEKERREIL
jgi:hypothetical protein